jgi:hypothetical protein
MRPFVNDLFSMMKGFTNSYARRHLSEGAKICVLMWRCCLCLIEFGSPDKFCRSIDSYLLRPPTILVEFDGSLTGIGVLIYKLHPSGGEELWKVSRYVFPFHLDGDSSFQNTCEFMGLLLAVGCLVSLGIRSISVKARGDSTTALKWIVTERFKSGPSRNAAMCYIALGMRFDINFEESTHIPGTDNIVCDKLSRDFSPKQLGFDEDAIIDVASDFRLIQLMSAANPLDDSGSSNFDGFVQKWKSVFEIAKNFE